MATRYRCSIEGNLGDGEVFSFGFGVYSATDANIGTIQGALAVMATSLFDAIPNNLRNYFAPDVVVNRVKTQALDPAGVVVDALTTAVGPYAGGSTSDPSGPYEVSMCVTLRSAISTRRSRGRLYLPPMHRQSYEGNGRFISTRTTGVVNTLKAAFDVFNDTDKTIVVFSKTTNPVTHFPIISLSAGNIPDAQRRRRNRQVETRAEVFLTP